MHEPYHFRCCTFLIILVVQLINSNCGFSQADSNQHRIYFISDVQAPMWVEKIIGKPYRNEEARDSLFKDLVIQHPENLFLLGDLSMRGSKKTAWKPLDTLLYSLKKLNTSVYAIPGNHEYMGKSAGMKMFKQRFKTQWLNGYYITLDSITIVMLNSNFKAIDKKELSKQLAWYKSVMDSLETNQSVKAIIVCTHHAPYSNSKVVGSSKPVQEMILPAFEKSQKSKLFISGHSHNLEYFYNNAGKHFLVIGGGGGIAQPLKNEDKRENHDLINQNEKPLYFYLIIEKNCSTLKLIAKGFKRDFSFFESEIGVITLN